MNNTFEYITKESEIIHKKNDCLYTLVMYIHTTSI
jgi:hypothetical protein